MAIDLLKDLMRQVRWRNTVERFNCIPKGERHYAAKLSTIDVEVIRCCRGLLTQKTVARIFNISQGNVCKIQASQTWR